MSLPFLLPALKLLTAAVGLSAVVTAAAGTPAASGAVTPPVARPAVPATIGGFAPGVDVSPRLACGPVLATLRTDHAGVLRLPADLFAPTAPGGYRLLVSGPPPASAATGGTVVVTVPRTEILGVRVDAAHRAWVDPAVPVPTC